jgi:hypothetical protein
MRARDPGQRLVRLRRRLSLAAASAEQAAGAPLAPERIRQRFDPRAGLPGEIFGAGFSWDGFAARCLTRGELVFFDIETGGLGDAPIFLVGALHVRRIEVGETASPLERELVLAPDPALEGLVLQEAAARLAQAPIWVSFNGRSFDLPRLRKRAFRHGVEWPGDPEAHLDLLVEVRRRWRGLLPDCRLGTVERRLLGLERGPGDLPGREVPERYRDFVATGERRWIEPILEHNRRDLAAMAVLLDRLVAEGALSLPEPLTPRRRSGGN